MLQHSLQQVGSPRKTLPAECLQTRCVPRVVKQHDVRRVQADGSPFTTFEEEILSDEDYEAGHVMCLSCEQVTQLFTGTCLIQQVVNDNQIVWLQIHLIQTLLHLHMQPSQF